MIRALFAGLAFVVPAVALAAPFSYPRDAEAVGAFASMPSRPLDLASTPRAQFKAPRLGATKITLAAPIAEKLSASGATVNGALRIGTVRDLPKASTVESWTAVDGGFALRLQARSEGALGIRVKLELSNVATPFEVRAQGNDGRVEWMSVDPSKGAEAWTPWTEGAEQMVEIFSPVELEAGAVRAGAIVHFTDSPFTKAASSCTNSTACTTGDSSLDSAMAERKKSEAKISFVDA